MTVNGCLWLFYLNFLQWQSDDFSILKDRRLLGINTNLRTDPNRYPALELMTDCWHWSSSCFRYFRPRAQPLETRKPLHSLDVLWRRMMAASENFKLNGLKHAMITKAMAEARAAARQHVQEQERVSTIFRSLDHGWNWRIMDNCVMFPNKWTFHLKMTENWMDLKFTMLTKTDSWTFGRFKSIFMGSDITMWWCTHFANFRHL